MIYKKILIIIGGPLTTSRISHLRKILDIVGKIFNEIMIIHEGQNPLNIDVESGKVKIIYTDISNVYARTSLPLRIIGYVVQEFKKFRIILKHTREGYLALFLGIYQPISLLSTKFRKCLTIVFGGGFDVTRENAQNKFFNNLYLIFRWSFQITMLKLFDKIILESSSVKDFYNLGSFEKKIFYANLFVPQIFTFTKAFNQRDIDVAFIGTFSKEKGILEFLEASKILKNKNLIRSMRTLVLGDGILKDAVECYINKNGLSNFMELKKFVNTEDLVKLLNSIKLVVIPSYSEGLPNLLIEAMACGTPVLASPVGGIPDVIKEGETGFLLESNDPKHIANKIIELLSKSELLERVSKNAYEYVRENFSYEKTLQAWRKTLQQLQQA